MNTVEQLRVNFFLMNRKMFEITDNLSFVFCFLLGFFYDKNNVGFNLAGLKLMQRQIEEQDNVVLFADATQNLTSIEGRKRRKGKSSTTVLTMKGTSALAQ